jgi:beta-lactamase class A
VRGWRGPIGALVLALVALGASVAIAHSRHDRSASAATVHATAAAAKAKKHPRPTKSAHSMLAFLASRHDTVGAAVINLRTGRTYSFHPGRREQTASIVKVDILETLLHEAQDQGRDLSSSEQATATGMIEASDNDDASDLYGQEGGAGAVAAYNKLAGLRDTTPNVAWGLTETTAPDQLALLEQLSRPGAVLKPPYQQYQLGLMSNIDAGEDWGVSGGVPSGVQVALKNGWLPLDSTDGDPSGAPDWQVNSIGRVRGDGRWYLIAVLSTGNATEGYGIDTIQGISGRIWNDLKS